LAIAVGASKLLKVPPSRMGQLALLSSVKVEAEAVLRELPCHR